MNSGIAGKLRSAKDALNNLHDDTILISQPLVVSCLAIKKNSFLSVLVLVIHSD